MNKVITPIVFAILSSITSVAFGGGLVTLDRSNHIAHLQFKVVIYSDITNHAMARVLRDYTNRAWRGQGLLNGDVPTDNFIKYQSQQYRIEPHIEVESMSLAAGEAAALDNKDPSVNYFYANYGQSGGGTMSYVPELGSSCGYLELNMQLDTLAHEMGHNLKMNHRNTVGARPPLMYPTVDAATVLQDVDTDQIELPAPNADGSFTMGRPCTPAETVMREPEIGSRWDFASLATDTISELRLYPNPVTRGQTVKGEFASTVSGSGELQLYDTNGRLVSHAPIAINEGMNSIQVESSRIPSAGTYFVRIYQAGFSRKDLPTSKLIVY